MSSPDVALWQCAKYRGFVVSSGETEDLAARSLPKVPAELFRLLVDQISEYAIFMLDTSGHVLTWNAGAERIKGYRAEEIVGQHFSKFYRPEDAWKCAAELDIASRLGRVEDEGHRVRKDGSLFWANVVITCLHGEHGEVVGFAKVTRDLTERKRSEEALRQSDERFRLLVENVKDYAIFMLDPTGHVATWNVGAERIKGYRAEEIIGQHFSRFYPDDEVRSGKCEYELEVATREGRFEDEGYRVRKDGSRFWANVVITALFGTKGELVGFAKVTRDLTERRAAENERLKLGQLARERIRALTAFSEALASARSADDVTRAVVAHGTALAKADVIALYLLDEATRELVLVAERGSNPELLAQNRRIGAGSDNPMYRVGTGEHAAAWLETPEQYAAFAPTLANASVAGPRARAFACVPLVAEGRTIGVFSLGFCDPHAFSDDDREFVATFVRQAAQALSRARRLESERAAAALAERLRASLATTMRSIGDAVIATDAGGAITLMNGVAESLTGYTEAHARGRPLPEIFRILNERTRAIVPSPVDKVLESGGVVGLGNHAVLVRPDGREIPIDDSGAPIRADGGPIEGVVLVFRDVTERKREEFRRAFLAEATSVLGQSLDYEVTVGRVAELAVPRLADWCAVDLVVESDSRPKRLAVVHSDPEKVALAKELAAKYQPQPNASNGASNGVSNVLRTGRSELHRAITDALLAGCADSEELRCVRALGLRSAMIVPMVVKGRVLGAMTFAFAESLRAYGDADLAVAEELARRCAAAIENALLYSSEQRARRSADVANRAKDEFLAVVSHELRTPLNAIMGWAKLLTRPEFDERRRVGALETIERNAVAMAQLIEDLLDMSRVISGKMRLELEQVELGRVVESALDTVRPAAAAKGIELTATIDPTVGPISADPTRLQQIVWNLLSNAVKYTAKGGRARIDVTRADATLEIVVQDTGKGINPAFLPFVFEAFRQEDASASRTRGGLGLGLAITKQLVELHGGRIGAESEGEGRGSTFHVSLPLAPATKLRVVPDRAGRLIRTDATFERPPQLRGLRVLVVDDEEDARRLVGAILQDCGCEVTLASSVEEALARIAELKPDVLLSDIGMPEEDGYDLIEKVRALPPERGGDVPAAALTAYARPEDRRRMLNAGYSIHLAKPIEPAELVAVVTTLTRFSHRSEPPPQ
jgi:PAS domain S-box-containing protein